MKPAAEFEQDSDTESDRGRDDRMQVAYVAHTTVHAAKDRK